MYRYDGRKSNRPAFATVQDAFASIGVNYDAARKLVYRDMRKRELEAIHSPKRTKTSAFPLVVFATHNATHNRRGRDRDCPIKARLHPARQTW
jgi:hypothetical protein